MKIFLSATEGCSKLTEPRRGLPYFTDRGVKLKWNLVSYFYARGKQEIVEWIRDNSELIEVDSGAHSFQKGVHVDWDEYTREYAEWIKTFDRPNVVGFFEMDVDNVVGYEKVLELRKILEKDCDKIIPVWHKNRGVEEYRKMCEEYAGKVVAITGFRNEDIRDEQYLNFLAYAHKFGCKVHCLGMARTAVLDKVPFDYTDASSWLQRATFGWAGKTARVSAETSKERRDDVLLKSYVEAQEECEKYYQKWRKVCND